MWYRYSRYIHNPEKSPYFHDMYGQDIEPAGKYILEQYKDMVPEGWERGDIHFKNPLIIDFGGLYSDPSNWKQMLYAKYKLKGKKLSDKLKKEGHDGIITIKDGETSEIVIL